MTCRPGWKKVIGIMAVLASIWTFIGSVDPVGAEDLSGDYCFAVKQASDENGPNIQGPFTLKAHIMPVSSGSAYYILQGRITGLIDNATFYVGGTGLPVGNFLVFSLTVTQVETNANSGFTMQIKLDSTTLKGSYWFLGTKFRPASLAFENKYSAGRVAKTTCK